MKAPKKTAGSELRAMREQREMADPKHEATRREASFLANLSRAQDDFDWITSHEAWKLLGHETFAAWWEARVQPLMRGLSMRPSRELAEEAADRIRDEEANLPPSMRRRERELAEFVGATHDEIRNRSPRSSLVGIPTKDDLPPDPLASIPEAQRAVDEHLNQTSGPVDASPADESGEQGPESNAADNASGPAAGDGASADRPSPAATPSAAPALDLVDTPIGPMTRGFAEALDKLVPDPNPHREWQSEFLKVVFAARKAFRAYKGEEIAEKADDQLREEFADLVADLDQLLRDVSQAQIHAGGAKVRKLRSVQ